MSQSGGQQESSRAQQVLSLTIAVVALQVGCLTLFIIVGSLVAGLWLDRTLDTLPIFLIVFLVGSMPLSWVAIFFVVNRAKQRLKTNPAVKDNTFVFEEENDSDRD
jgi:F0F1-type ATP synthase assembly protein I